MPEVAQGLGLLLWVWFLLYFLFPPIPQTVYLQVEQNRCQNLNQYPFDS